MFDRISSLFKTEFKKEQQQKVSTAKPKQKADFPVSAYTTFQDIVPAEMTTVEQLKQYKSWVYAALYLRASMVAKMELTLNKMVGDEVETVSEHPVLDLFDRVNNQMTFYGLMKYSSLVRNLTGECYWFSLLDSKGEPIEIYPWLSPANMEVVAAKSITEFIKGFVYSVPGSSEKISLTTQEVIQFQYPSPTNPYRGMSPIKAAAMAIETDKASSAWNWRFFKNNGVPRGVLDVKARYNETLYQQIRAKWDEGHRGEDNANKVAILFSGGGDNDISFKEIGISQKDMDFLKQRGFARDEILSILGVPYSILDPTENISRATVEAAQVNFMTNTILPEMREWVEEINEFLLPKFKNSEGLFFDFVDPTPEDRASKLATYQSGLTLGWLTLDEVRNMENLPPIETQEETQGETQEEEVAEEEEEKDKIKYRKFNVNVKKNRKGTNLAKKVNEVLKDKDHIIRKLVKQKSKKKNKNITKEFEDKGLAKWNKKTMITDKKEEQLTRELQKFFNQEAKRVRNTLKVKRVKRWGKIKEISYDYDKDAEVAALVTILDPYYRDLIKEFGQESLDELGLVSEFDMTKYILEYIDKYILRGVEEITQVTKDLIAEQLKIGITEGESIDKITKRIMGVFAEADEIRAAMIARTEISRASNAGSYFGYLQSGVVEKVQWWTAGDERTCPFCAPMHGRIEVLGTTFYDRGEVIHGQLTPEQIFKESKADPILKLNYEAIYHPPLHVNCRCTLLPITSPIKEYSNTITKIAKQKFDERLKDEKLNLENEYKNKIKVLEAKENKTEEEKKRLSSLIEKLENE